MAYPIISADQLSEYWSLWP